MREKELTQVIGAGMTGYPIHSIMSYLASQNAKLTIEERAEREEKRRLLAEQRIRRGKILRHICPNCEGKLTRGKKDKKNDYKRSWNCGDCTSKWMDDGNLVITNTNTK